MKVFKNKFLELLYQEDENLLIGNWTLETENADKNDFKSWNAELVKNCQQYNPKGFLANVLDYKFIIIPDLQEWSVFKFI